MLFPVRYVNHLGELFTLSGDGAAFLDTLPLRAYEWSYQVTQNLSGLGGSAAGFSRPPRAVQTTLGLRAFQRATFAEAANRFHAITEADIQAETPGTLYLGSQYAYCFLTGASVASYSKKGSWYTKQVTLLFTQPYWFSEKSYTFHAADSGSSDDTTGKKFDLRFPYRYGTALTAGKLNNTHYGPCPAVFTIYGPVSNPLINIAGNLYGAYITLSASERLEIDQLSHTLTRIDGSGARHNAFATRVKTSNIFAPIPVGPSAVIYNGDFRFDLTLIQQRSEPLWT